jgi:hypothetical protein
VVEALGWLKLNHEGYTDLEISQENLDSYEERDIPVVVDYRRTAEDISDAPPGGTTAVFETPNEYGTKSGKCSFSVHGLRRSELPVSMYDEVGAYPGMFPWLFPYGKGGIGHQSHSKKTRELTRKRNLLRYHDKCFQVDTYFPMIAFNHEQLKAASTGSMLLAKRSIFDGVARRLSAVNYLVAGNIADRMAAGDHVRAIQQSKYVLT